MTKEVLKKLKDIKTPSDVCDNIVSLLDEVSKTKDKSLLKKVYDQGKKAAKKNYRANMNLCYGLAISLKKPDEAYNNFNTVKLDDPEQMDDVFNDATSLLRACGRDSEEIKHLEQDASAMFDESGNYNPDWANS
jgi:hypothetical protein